MFGEAKGPRVNLTGSREVCGAAFQTQRPPGTTWDGLKANFLTRSSPWWVVLSSAGIFP